MIIHVRSLKVIGTNSDLSATCDFLLLFHGNQGPISYRFQDKRRFRSKILNFLHLLHIYHPRWEVPLETG